MNRSVQVAVRVIQPVVGELPSDAKHAESRRKLVFYQVRVEVANALVAGIAVVFDEVEGGEHACILVGHHHDAARFRRIVACVCPKGRIH